MENNNFSVTQLAVFNFFETKIKKINLYKVNEKVKKTIIKINQDNQKDKQQAALKEQAKILKNQRAESLKNEIPDWITDCAQKAIEVNKPMFKVTHPIKYANANIAYSGICVTTNTKNSKPYLTTETLKETQHDIAMSNGNLISHGRFLAHKLDDETVYEKLAKQDYLWLSEFSQNKDQVKSWEEGLSFWVSSLNTPEASRLKQNYFYMADGSYHIVAPLFSSTLYQDLYEKIRDKKFGKTNIELRKAKKDGKYAKEVLAEFANLAKINFGGSQPQNISVANFERHGNVFLLPCNPPKWQTILKPPSANINSIFDGEFNHRAWALTKELQLFLVKLHKKRGNKAIRNEIKDLIYQIIGVLFNYVAEVQSLKDQAGWSKNLPKLKQTHKLWLDIYRKDEDFKQQRDSNKWQQEVCADFGLWLNARLKHKKMVFGTIESSHWAKLLNIQLREFELALGGKL